MKWYIVQTKPWQEKKALFFLEQKGVLTYSPRMEAHFYKGIRLIKKEKSLFTNYIFIRCEKELLSDVCWTWGVKKILWTNNLPVPIPDELINSIRLLEDKDGIIRKKSVQEFKKDEIVRIKSGPFRDLLAIFDYWDSDMERVSVLINMAKTVARIHLPVDIIEKV